MSAVLCSCGDKVKQTQAETDDITEATVAAEEAEETSLDTVIESVKSAMTAIQSEIGSGCKVDFIKEEIDIYDESGKLLILTGQFIYPVVTMQDSPEAEKAINAYFETEKEKYYIEAEKMHADSLELLGNFESDYWNTFIYDKKYSLEFLNSELLSFLCHTDIYLGGAHPTPDESGLIFDLSDGHAVTMDELFVDVDAMRAFVLPIIKSEVEKSEPFENYAQFLPDLVDDGTFYLGSGGVTFICNVYVLFPYAYGISYYTVPYEDLSEYLSFSITESEPFSRFYSFDIEGEDGENVLGYLDTREFSCPYDETDTCIINGDERYIYYIISKNVGSDVSIEHVIYDDEGNEKGSEVYKTFKNTPKDFCLKINCPMSESKPLYRVIISYENSGSSIDLIYSPSSDKPVKLIK
ncbi:MAG: DUF4163 domain-containing protein [Clostridia bacterium]|nr:DUF4163 domain-containing protein [Clostridia bacterium]